MAGLACAAVENERDDRMHTDAVGLIAAGRCEIKDPDGHSQVAFRFTPSALEASGKFDPFSPSPSRRYGFQTTRF